MKASYLLTKSPALFATQEESQPGVGSQEENARRLASSDAVRVGAIVA